MKSIFKEWICIHCGLQFADVYRPQAARLSDKGDHVCRFMEYKEGEDFWRKRKRIRERVQCA